VFLFVEFQSVTVIEHEQPGTHPEGLIKAEVVFTLTGNGLRSDGKTVIRHTVGTNIHTDPLEVDPPTVPAAVPKLPYTQFRDCAEIYYRWAIVKEGRLLLRGAGHRLENMTFKGKQVFQLDIPLHSPGNS
jgi:hypothetical protein